MDDELQALRHNVERLLGRCVLRLQVYERTVKGILAAHEFSGTVHNLDEVQAARAAAADRKTLGAAINELLGSYLTSFETAETSQMSQEPSPDEPSLRVWIRLALPADDLARTESDLREFVLLRNNLVHHFFEKHDLTSLEGCRTAEQALDAALDRIEHHSSDLRQWAKELEQVRLSAAAVYKSDMFRDLIVSGKVPWPFAEIVDALREASAELSLIDGWTPVKQSSEWISVRHPGEVPENYGCSAAGDMSCTSPAFSSCAIFSTGKGNARRGTGQEFLH